MQYARIKVGGLVILFMIQINFKLNWIQSWLMCLSTNFTIVKKIELEQC